MPIGTSRVVSSHVDKENCSSSDGMEMSSGSTRGDDCGGTKAEGMVGVTKESYSSWF